MNTHTTFYILTPCKSHNDFSVCGSECGNISFVMNYVFFCFDCKYICCLCKKEVTKRIMLHSELNTTAVIAADVLFLVFKKVIFATLHLLHI